MKSSFSNPSGDCVDVNHWDGEDVFVVGDTKNPTGPTLKFTRDEWDAFIKGVKAGEFDPES